MMLYGTGGNQDINAAINLYKIIHNNFDYSRLKSLEVMKSESYKNLYDFQTAIKSLGQITTYEYYNNKSYGLELKKQFIQYMNSFDKLDLDDFRKKQINDSISYMYEKIKSFK